jgi:hypothetical protein
VCSFYGAACGQVAWNEGAGQQLAPVLTYRVQCAAQASWLTICASWQSAVMTATIEVFMVLSEITSYEPPSVVEHEDEGEVVVRKGLLLKVLRPKVPKLPWFGPVQLDTKTGMLKKTGPFWAPLPNQRTKNS